MIYFIEIHVSSLVLNHAGLQRCTSSLRTLQNTAGKSELAFKNFTNTTLKNVVHIYASPLLPDILDPMQAVAF